MHHFKIVSVAVLGVFAFAGLVVASAAAEMPSLNVLPGERASELTFSGKATRESKIETINGKTFSCATAKISATFEGVGASATKGKATTDREGCKKEKASCRSETPEGAKDPPETILAPLALTAASEETSAKALQFLLVESLTETLLLNCGGLKWYIKGSMGCLAGPTLTELLAGEAVTVGCAIEPKGKQKTGTCRETKAACEKLVDDPLLGNFGTGFEGAAEEFSFVVTFNKMATFVD